MSSLWAPRIVEVSAMIVRIGARILPPLLEAIDGGASAEVAALGVLGRLQERGIGPVSPKTVELFTMAVAALVFDLRAAEPPPAPEPPDLLGNLVRSRSPR